MMYPKPKKLVKKKKRMGARVMRKHTGVRR